MSITKVTILVNSVDDILVIQSLAEYTYRQLCTATRYSLHTTYHQCSH